MTATGSLVSRLSVSTEDGLAAYKLSSALWPAVDRQRRRNRELIFLCVGTDRCTGDALGPLTGSLLIRRSVRGARILGTLEQPVHAANLQTVLADLAQRPIRPCIVAVDAGLGRRANVGQIHFRSEALVPGTAACQTLPPVGDCHILGIVNVGGFMQQFVLQSTRLHLVCQMADVIARTLSHTARRWAACAAADEPSRPAPADSLAKHKFPYL